MWLALALATDGPARAGEVPDYFKEIVGAETAPADVGARNILALNATMLDGDERAPFRSVKAAVEMLQANDRMGPQMEANYGHAIPIGIGVYYGEAVIGTLGSAGKERLTAIDVSGSIKVSETVR